METNIVYQGDCLDVMADFPDNSVDTIITDPPYNLTSISKRFKNTSVEDDNLTGVAAKDGKHQYGRLSKGFMGKDWDNGIAFDPTVWRECLRVAKPGATLMAFGGTRTHHRLMAAIEDAGWEIRDCISHFHSSDDREMALLDSMNEDQVQAYLELHYPNEMRAWVYGSGFPKSHDISKGLDRAKGMERKVVGLKIRPDGKPVIDGRRNGFAGQQEGWTRPWQKDQEKVELQASITAPSTPLVKQFSGFGTAMKPAFEIIIVAQKPIEKNYAYNAEKWGVAGLNIDGGRVGTNGSDDYGRSAKNSSGTVNAHDGFDRKAFSIKERTGDYKSSKGRWAANVLLSHSAGCVRTNYADSDGHETTEDWDCESDCAVRLLDEESGVLTSGAKKQVEAKNFNDSVINFNTNKYRINSNKTVLEASKGGASRFFKNFPPARFVYSGKASRKERGEGNNHPTVKSLKVAEYLALLTRTPTGGIILDPFGGSGTTALAALATDRPYILIEKEAEYVEIANRRIAGYTAETISPSEVQEEAGQLTLW